MFLWVVLITAILFVYTLFRVLVNSVEQGFVQYKSNYLVVLLPNSHFISSSNVSLKIIQDKYSVIMPENYVCNLCLSILFNIR